MMNPLKTSFSQFLLLLPICLLLALLTSCSGDAIRDGSGDTNVVQPDSGSSDLGWNPNVYPDGGAPHDASDDGTTTDSGGGIPDEGPIPDSPHTDLFDGGPSDEICDDHIDNDLDSFIDCYDQDCWNSPLCPDEDVEDCENGVDDDGDGQVDCDDTDCATSCGGEDPMCAFLCPFDPAGAVERGCTCDSAEDCDNEIDDNGNGLLDCDDPACHSDPACEGPDPTEHEWNCSDGRDNDGDGLEDCYDGDCDDDPACVSTTPELNCSDDLDNDGDGDVDCDDPDCEVACSGGNEDPICVIMCDISPSTGAMMGCACGDGTPEDCDNETDDDGNGLYDCDDPFCDEDPACE